MFSTTTKALAAGGLLVLLAFSTSAQTGADGRWTGPHGLTDQRLEEAVDLSAAVRSGTVQLPLARPVIFEGRRFDAIELGVGWLRLSRTEELAAVERDLAGGDLGADALPGPRIDVLSGDDLRLGPTGRVLVESRLVGTVIRWVGLEGSTGEQAIVEAVVDAFGTIRLQYLRLPPSARAGLAEGRLRSGLATAGQADRLSPNNAEAFVLPREVVGLVGRPALPRPFADGPPPSGCDPAVGTWCDLADGTGDTILVLVENFDDGLSESRGWSKTNAWMDVDYSVCSPGATQPGGRSWYFGNVSSCQYGSNQTGSLTSPNVGPVPSNAFFDFDFRLSLEQNFDFAEILVNGTLIGALNDPPSPNRWYSTGPLPLRSPPDYDFTGQNIRLEFRFSSDNSASDLGWFVDDVIVWGEAGGDEGCVLNAGRGRNSSCELREADRWQFNEDAFCAGCEYTFYIRVDCGQQLHLPLLDMEGAEVSVTRMDDGLPVDVRCMNQTALNVAAGIPPPTLISLDCCGGPTPEEWYLPPLDVTGTDAGNPAEWGFPNCSDQRVLDSDGDGQIECSELPGCGGVLPNSVSPGESQVIDCVVEDPGGICGIYRVDVVSGGFSWDLFANCDGQADPQYPIYFDCTEAWSAYEPLPQLVIENTQVLETCPDLSVSFEVKNNGCAATEGDVSVEVRSLCDPPDVMAGIVPGPIAVGESVLVDVPLTLTCENVQVEITVDPDDVLRECDESADGANCAAGLGATLVTVEACPCEVDNAMLPVVPTTCPGDPIELDASGLDLSGCLTGLLYEWRDDSGALVGTDAVTMVPAPAVSADFTVDVTCDGRPLCTQGLVVSVPVQSPVDTAPADSFTCAGEPGTLDASGLGFEECPSGVSYEWRDLGGALLGSGPTLDVSPASDTDYEVTVTCDDAPSCSRIVLATMRVDEPPTMGAGSAVDADTCGLGLELNWDAATFRGPSGTGTYSVYRSEVDCADAVTRLPLLFGLTDLTWTDRATVAGRSYHYVVEAEDDRVGTACSPAGPFNGGAVDRLCLAPALEVADGPIPEGVFNVLLMGHVGEEVTASWAASRPLIAGETFVLLKAVMEASEPFVQVNPLGDVSQSYSETDTVFALQFFDLRVASDCGQLSDDEYPPG